MMKLTTKTTKNEMTNFLNENFKVIAKLDKNLADRISYTANTWKKDPKKVTTNDLKSLVTEANKLLPDVKEEVAVTAENSVKTSGKSLKKSSKKNEPKNEKPADKNASKKSTNKAPEKEASVSTLPATNSQTIPLAKMFSETFETEESKFEIAHDIKTLDDLTKALAKEETVIATFYWTKRHLKQFPYMNGKLKAPASFVNDLDLAQFIYVSDEGVVAYAVSMYTDGFYTVLPENFEEFEGLRLCDGIEFQIYRQVQ